MRRCDDWSRAYPALAFEARFKVEDADFRVEETLRFHPDASQGEHWYVLLRSRGWNTQALARRLASAAGVSARQVGYAGLKDKHAVSTQWFSVQLPKTGRDDPAVWLRNLENVELLRWTRHSGKLRIGAVQRNRFVLVLRDCAGHDRARVDERLNKMAEQGYPNYFGAQRFGHQGQTLEDAALWLTQPSGNRKRRHRLQGIYLSAIRGWFFNRLLAAKVASGGWLDATVYDHFMKGDKGGVFRWTEDDPSVPSRLVSGEIHPALPLAVDAKLAEPDHDKWTSEEKLWLDRLDDFRLSEAFRAARVIPGNLTWQWKGDNLELCFDLPAGAYATGLLRELGRVRDASQNLGSRGINEQERT